MRKLREAQKKIRSLYLCRMRGECPMPGQKPKKKKKLKIPKKVSGMKKMLKDLKHKKKRLKKDKKKLKKLLKNKDSGVYNSRVKDFGLDSLAKGAVKVKDGSNTDQDLQQFKKELFDDYEDNDAKAGKSGKRTIKKRMKKALKSIRYSDLGNTDGSSATKDASSHLYNGIWGDHDLQMSLNVDVPPRKSDSGRRKI